MEPNEANCVLFLFLIAVGSNAQKRKLSEDEAVKFAEVFIARNGYTDLPPDRSKLAYETIEWESNIDKILKGRHNTLERKAYGIVRGRKGGAPGWTVVFLFKQPASGQVPRVGRAVTMNLNGGKPRMEHVSFNLNYVNKKL